MEKVSKKISIAISTALLTVGLMALPVLANTQNPGYYTGTGMMNNQGTLRYTSTVNRVLDSLVSAGTLTQEQEDAILSSIQEIENGGLKTVLDGLITAGTLTQEQEDAILSSIQSKGIMVNQGFMKDVNMTGNHGSIRGTGMRNHEGSTHGKVMAGNRGAIQGKNMTSNRGSMHR